MSAADLPSNLRANHGESGMFSPSWIPGNRTWLAGDESSMAVGLGARERRENTEIGSTPSSDEFL